MDNQLLKYGAKDYFFRATLCRMCQEVEDATTTIGKYEEMFPAFSDSRECKLVKVKILTNSIVIKILRYLLIQIVIIYILKLKKRISVLDFKAYLLFFVESNSVY